MTSDTDPNVPPATEPQPIGPSDPLPDTLTPPEPEPEPEPDVEPQVSPADAAQAAQAAAEAAQLAAEKAQAAQAAQATQATQSAEQAASHAQEAAQAAQDALAAAKAAQAAVSRPTAWSGAGSTLLGVLEAMNDQAHSHGLDLATLIGEMIHRHAGVNLVPRIVDRVPGVSERGQVTKIGA